MPLFFAQAADAGQNQANAQTPAQKAPLQPKTYQ